MSTAANLLTDARRAGVHLDVNGDDLVARGPLTEDMVSALRAHKSALLQLLTAKEDSPEQGAIRPDTLLTDEPAGTCPCGSGSYHQAAADGPWLCASSHPRTRSPVAVLAVPGGRLSAGLRQGVDQVLREAVVGLPITDGELRAWLDPADLADIARGLIPAATVRGYAAELARRGILTQ